MHLLISKRAGLRETPFTVVMMVMMMCKISATHSPRLKNRIIAYLMRVIEGCTHNQRSVERMEFGTSKMVPRSNCRTWDPGLNQTGTDQ